MNSRRRETGGRHSRHRTGLAAVRPATLDDRQAARPECRRTDHDGAQRDRGPAPLVLRTRRRAPLLGDPGRPGRDRRLHPLVRRGGQGRQPRPGLRRRAPGADAADQPASERRPDPHHHRHRRGRARTTDPARRPVAGVPGDRAVLPRDRLRGGRGVRPGGRGPRRLGRPPGGPGGGRGDPRRGGRDCALSGLHARLALPRGDHRDHRAGARLRRPHHRDDAPSRRRQGVRPARLDPGRSPGGAARRAFRHRRHRPGRDHRDRRQFRSGTDRGRSRGQRPGRRGHLGARGACDWVGACGIPTRSSVTFSSCPAVTRRRFHARVFPCLQSSHPVRVPRLRGSSPPGWPTREPAPSWRSSPGWPASTWRTTAPRRTRRPSGPPTSPSRCWSRRDSSPAAPCCLASAAG